MRDPRPFRCKVMRLLQRADKLAADRVELGLLLIGTICAFTVYCEGPIEVLDSTIEELQRLRARLVRRGGVGPS